MSHEIGARRLLVSLDEFLIRRQFITASERFSTPTSSTMPSNINNNAIPPSDITAMPSNTNNNAIPPSDITAMPPGRPKPKRRTSRIPVPNDAWKTVSKRIVPFLAIPPEIHLKVFEFLHPVEAVCLSVVNKYIYNLAPTLNYPLGIGAPDSTNPLAHPSGCHHCLPVLFYPAHCELHFHLRPIIPSHLKFCASCSKFTACQDGFISDREEYCGHCGTAYQRRFARGRRMIDMQRPGEKQERLRKWYNESTMRAEAEDIIRMGESN